jgi:hypothetical protein
MIITNEVYKTKWQAEEDYHRIVRTIISCNWLSQTAKYLNICPYDMYDIVKTDDRKWKINATPEHLAATQKFYKIV